jgi:hypothetical protein
MRLPLATKPSPTSVAGERSAVGGGSRLLGEIQLPLYLRGDGGDIGDHYKRGCERGAVGASNLAYLPQYDRFIGIWDEKWELLEMLSKQLYYSIFDSTVCA